MFADSGMRRVRFLLPLCGGLLFAGLWLGYRGYFLDDAFITFRYARNLAAGLGPVFNVGEPVEGYTTFAWMLVCSIPFALFESARALDAIKVLGLVLGLAVLWRAFRFPGPTGEVRWRPGVVLLAASPVFILNCGDGLETPLYALLLLEFTRAAVGARTFRGGLLCGGLLALLVMTRPEALPLLIALPLALAVGQGSVRGLLRFTAGLVAAAAVPIGTHIGWRLAYYGVALPNTYYAKAMGALAPRVSSGLADVGALVSGGAGPFPVELWLALALAATGTAIALRRGDGAVRVWYLVLWLGVGSRVAFDIWSGGAWMGVFRFLAPGLPLLCVIADEGVRTIGAHEAFRSRRARQVGAAALAVGLSAGVAFGVVGHIARVKTSAGYRLSLDRGHVALGNWLRERYAKDTWVAIGDSGAVPFYSELPTIDLFGLVDATVARLPGEYGHRPGTAEYALERRPGVIVLWTPVPIEERPAGLEVRGVSSFDSAILEHPTFRRDYHFVREFAFRPELGRVPGYYLAVFER